MGAPVECKREPANKQGRAFTHAGNKTSRILVSNMPSTTAMVYITILLCTFFTTTEAGSNGSHGNAVPESDEEYVLMSPLHDDQLSSGAESESKAIDSVARDLASRGVVVPFREMMSDARAATADASPHKAPLVTSTWTVKQGGYTVTHPTKRKVTQKGNTTGKAKGKAKGKASAKTNTKAKGKAKAKAKAKGKGNLPLLKTVNSRVDRDVVKHRTDDAVKKANKVKTAEDNATKAKEKA